MVLKGEPRFGGAFAVLWSGAQEGETLDDGVKINIKG